ncbi:MAG: prephenate dehydrogenase [Chloroflexota bacterium]|nr:prephenate dehydrogenase [Chloroflexota bacterium]
MDKIAIIGLGLIGTSMGLAIRQTQNRNIEVVGIDLEPTHTSTARKMGAIDRDVRTIPDAVRGADLVIVAIPVLAMRDLFEFIAEFLKEGAIVTDTGSTKKDVMEWAAELLPAGVSFIGGHPLAGKETSGPRDAEAALLNGAVYAVCPAVNASEQAVQTVVSVVQAIGAKPYFVDPAEHDSYVAAISHLPFMLSVALVNATSKSVGWREMSRLASSGYRDISRLASGDPVMHRDIAVTNKESLVYWLDECIKDLHRLRGMVKDDQAGLEQALVDAWEARARWMLGREGDDATPTEGLKASDQFMGMLLGDTVAKRFRDMGEQKQDPTIYRRD